MLRSLFLCARTRWRYVACGNEVRFNYRHVSLHCQTFRNHRVSALLYCWAVIRRANTCMHRHDILNGSNSLFAWEKSQHHPWIGYGTPKDRHGIHLVTDGSGTLFLCRHDAHAQGHGRPRSGYKGLGDSESLAGTVDRPRQVMLRCHGPPYDKTFFLVEKPCFPERSLMLVKTPS